MNAIRNLPIRFKAFAASAVLLVSLIGLGADAYLVLDNTSSGLTQLNSSTLPKQEIIQSLTNDVTKTHINVFRYAAWSSNSVSTTLLNRLSDEIFSGVARIDQQIKNLKWRPDLSVEESTEVTMLAARWGKYASAIRDTVDVGQIDPAMATMMLGGTDDDFQNVARHLQRITAISTELTRQTTETLSAQSDFNKRLIEIGGAGGILLSLLMTIVVARSLVRPVRAVTQALKQISFGDLEIDIDRKYRGRHDEIGQMVEAIVAFCGDMKRARDMLDQQRQQLHEQNLGSTRR